MEVRVQSQRQGWLTPVSRAKLDVDTLPSWGNSCEDQLNASEIAAETYQEETIRSPFLYNKDINGKVVLW